MSRGSTNTRAKVTGDLAKAVALSPHADAYALVLCTHVLGEIAPQLRRWVVKYSSGISEPQSHTAMPVRKLRGRPLAVS